MKSCFDEKVLQWKGASIKRHSTFFPYNIRVIFSKVKNSAGSELRTMKFFAYSITVIITNVKSFALKFLAYNITVITTNVKVLQWNPKE
jgi:hypothetical protein